MKDNSLIKLIRQNLMDHIPGLYIQIRDYVDPETGEESIILCATNSPFSRSELRSAFSKSLNNFYEELKKQNINIGTMIELEGALTNFEQHVLKRLQYHNIHQTAPEMIHAATDMFPELSREDAVLSYHDHVIEQLTPIYNQKMIENVAEIESAISVQFQSRPVSDKEFQEITDLMMERFADELEYLKDK